MSDAPLRASVFTEALSSDWDTFVEHSDNGTMLHTRRFLSYHGDRFRDTSLVLFTQDELVAVLPAAEDPQDPSLVVSHPGLTYGGLVYGEALRGERSTEALRLVSATFAEMGYARLRYRSVPCVYHTRLAEDDAYALQRIGATRSRCDLLTAIDLATERRLNHGRRYGAKRAVREGVEVDVSWQHLPAFWKVLEETLRSRFRATPVHSLTEINTLRERFPERVRLLVAERHGDVLAGVVLFAAGRALHMQYSAASDVGRRSRAMDLVIGEAIEIAKQGGFRFFALGTSNGEPGGELNGSLYEFKLSFGAGSIAQEEFELLLG